jgi:hypothetical protein
MQRFQNISNRIVSFAKTLTPKNPRSVKPTGEGRRLFRASAGSPAFPMHPGKRPPLPRMSCSGMTGGLAGSTKQCGYFLGRVACVVIYGVGCFLPEMQRRRSARDCVPAGAVSILINNCEVVTCHAKPG